MFQNASGLNEFCASLFETSEDLMSVEAQQFALRDRIATHIPYLSQHSRARSPPEYMWSHIVDFFACSDTHGWCDRDVMLSGSPALQSWSLEAMAHVLFRFSSLFSAPGALALGLRLILIDTLAMFSAELPNPDLERRISKVIPEPNLSRPCTSASPAGATFALFSGHDVTLFPLLVFLHRCSGLAPPTVWPGFASYLTLELHAATHSSSNAVIVWKFWDPYPFPDKGPPTDVDVPGHEIPFPVFVDACLALISEKTCE